MQWPVYISFDITITVSFLNFEVNKVKRVKEHYFNLLDMITHPFVHYFPVFYTVLKCETIDNSLKHAQFGTSLGFPRGELDCPTHVRAGVFECQFVDSPLVLYANIGP